jgi:hypothetical protein
LALQRDDHTKEGANTMIAPLLPCPFCGRTPDVNNPYTFQHIETSKYGGVICCVRGPEVHTDWKHMEHWRDAAIEKWNTRAPMSIEEGLVGRVAELTRELSTARDEMERQACLYAESSRHRMQMKAERDAAVERAEKAERAARVLCSAHAGQQFAQCPRCVSMSLSKELDRVEAEVASLRRTLAEAD